MSLRPSSVLVLDDANVPVLDLAGLDLVVHRVHGLLQAAAVLASERPRWLVMNPKRAWHRRVLAVIPRELRPAVIGIGDGTSDAVDAWLSEATPLPAALERAQREADRRAHRREGGRADFQPG
jgi:hypothetical protein